MAEDEARAAALAAVGPAAVQPLETFLAHCARWGAVSNLVSEADRRRLWSRHVLDSLQLVPLVPAGAQSLVDLGSGAGFPGMILAIARPDLSVTLVEASGKKAAFLLQAAAAAGARVRVEPRRIEDLAPEPRDVVTARALAPLRTLLTLAARFCGPHTLALFPKGRDAEAEIAEAERHASFALTRHPSRTDPEGVILALTAVKVR